MLGRVALLLFGSGFCALVYQTAWLRLFRLVFGASTAASAAVLALFMAGLGFGGLLLGRKADRHGSPLGFYGNLEVGISLAAGLSPALVWLVERIYLALGGSAVLGLAGSTVVRLLLATLVLGVPTFLMGGTLPAVARAVERSADEGRRVVGLLYAVNTLGAVLGALVATFFALEAFGIRKTIWIAALVNLLVAMAARNLARSIPQTAGEALAETEVVDEGRPAPVPLVILSAALVGFAFLLMELVWYRMLAPLLGGSSYTFGLILAVALLGIGLGGLLYGAGSLRRRPTLVAFAATCSLEALCLAFPFALGDRIAVLAALLRPLGSAGFLPLIGAWTAITAIVVLPAALVAGYQFPLLIALLGAGRRAVGREVGVTYAANTVGAIVGSIAGGFGLLPLLTAPGVWRLVTLLLLGLALAALLAGLRRETRRAALLPTAAGLAALLFCLAPGPSAFWRHSPIGAGRLRADWNGPNDIERKIRDLKRRIVWEAEGVESSVGLDLTQEYAFIVSGKSDGSIRSDAPTQVMSGLVGTLLHPDPKRALVIGLGTGSTSGWLGQVPSIERVDTVELEAAILHVAEVCAPANHDVLKNPKVDVIVGDGREFLLTTKNRYDVIFSEPSNPYRAGIASLFTEDFYRAVEQRMLPGGLFLQWMQGYELDAQVIRTVYATLASVFPSVESWQIDNGDLLLVASREPLVHDVERVRARAAREPYRSALSWVWGVYGAEGLYSGYVASPAFTRAVAEGEGRSINTDDHPILEFGFARNLGRVGMFGIGDLRRLVASRGEDRPALPPNAALDWNRVRELRLARAAFWDDLATDPELAADPAAARRMAARQAYVRQNVRQACPLWLSQPQMPENHLDLLLVTECLAAAGDPRAPVFLERLRADQPTEAAMALAFWHAASGRLPEASRQLTQALDAYRADPWPYMRLAERSLQLALDLARADRSLAPALYESLSRPFAMRMADGQRILIRVELSRLLPDVSQRCAEALAPLEPHVPWEGGFLNFRARCYEAAGHPLAARAAHDLTEYLENEPPPLGQGLPDPSAAAAPAP